MRVLVEPMLITSTIDSYKTQQQNNKMTFPKSLQRTITTKKYLLNFLLPGNLGN